MTLRVGIRVKYSEDQARDDYGRWTDEGGGGGVATLTGDAELAASVIDASGITSAPALAAAAYASLQATGGATLDTQTNTQPATGIALASPGQTEEVFRTEQVSASTIERYIEDHRSELEQSGRYLGVWEDRGFVHLDVSEVLQDRTEAEKLGSQRGELAGYDLQSGQDIPFASGSGPDNPINTNSVEIAARELAAGKYVNLEQYRGVSTLTDKLAEIGQEAKALGQQAPVYDLGKVTVQGTNIFLSENLGVDRAEMPQFSGIPAPGSPADNEAAFPKDSKGEVDLGDAYIQHLQSLGVEVHTEQVPSDVLRATQNGLDGVKVSGMMGAIEDGKLDPLARTIWTTRDDYVLDGHHLWAATVGVQYTDDSDKSLPVSSHVIDMSITDALRDAQDWTQEMGINPRAVGKMRHVGGTRVKYAEDQDRDERGRWTSGGGGAISPSDPRISQFLNEVGRGYNPALTPTPPVEITAGRNPDSPALRAAAAGYMKEAELPYKPDRTYVEVDVPRAHVIADLYDRARDEPHNPVVAAAYEAFKDETHDQYEYLRAQGYEHTISAREGEPYENSRAFSDDVRENHSLTTLPTTGPNGEITGANPDNPMLEKTGGIVTDEAGRPYALTYNDEFRWVHDIFGHVKEGNQTGPRGEENAWRQHVQMYSTEAARAMTTETRGQNSWLNYGPGNPGGNTPIAERAFPEQKVTVLPEWVSDIDGVPPAFKSFGDEGNTVTRWRSKYSEDQARDDWGRWSEGGGTNSEMPGVINPSPFGDQYLNRLSPMAIAKVEKAWEKFGVDPEALKAEVAARIGGPDSQVMETARQWYPDANILADRIVEHSGGRISLEQACGTIALCSPQTPWEIDREASARICQFYAEGKADGMTPAEACDVFKAEWQAQGWGGQTKGSDYQDNAKLAMLEDNVRNSFSILLGVTTVEEACDSVKVRSFYNDIYTSGESPDVTVDVHMGKMVGFTNPEMAKDKDAAEANNLPTNLTLANFNSVRGTVDKVPILESGAGYVTIAETTRAVADSWNERPSAVQAAYWSQVQDVNPSGWPRSIGSTMPPMQTPYYNELMAE